MKFLRRAKDGGPESTVTGYWLCEIKSLFSIALLKFEDGSRDAYHSHAFDSLNWVIKGEVEEFVLSCETAYGLLSGMYKHRPSWLPVVTRRSTFHKVVSKGTTWVLSIRGPWSNTWQEFVPGKGHSTLTHGRKAVV